MIMIVLMVMLILIQWCFLLQFGKVTLPSEVFASGHEEDEGLLNLAAPVAGPRPDWDPDIVAALDEALDLDDPDNILDDDFILKACL